MIAVPFRFSTRSLRFQLLVCSAGLLLVIGLLALMVVKRFAFETAQSTFDRPLANSALQILEEVRLEGGELAVDMPFSAFSGLADAPRDKVFYLVTTKQQAYVTGYQGLLANDSVRHKIQTYTMQLETSPEYFDLKFRGEYLRAALVGRVIYTRNGPQQVLVLVGQTAEARTEWEHQLSEVALKLITAVILCTLIVIVLLIYQVLKPVKLLNQKMMKRSNVDLTPIDLNVPEEVSHLVKSINIFMGQLDETLSNLKNFTSEAAHQLKTPLAGMRVQVELLHSRETSAETERALARVLEACDVLERTIEQLLNQATIKHRYRSIEPQSIHINALVEKVCRSLAIQALSRDIELSLQQEAQFSIVGDAFGVEQMLLNLIENAIKYSPNGKPVEVEVVRRGSKASIVIRDFGSGIADKDKPLVFERFHRLAGGEQTGTGLGMSIAADVAAHCRALLVLKDTIPNGLTVDIQFPYKIWQEAE